MSAEATAAWVAHVRMHVGLDAEREPGPFADVCAPNGPLYARTFVCTPNVPGDANSTCLLVAIGMLDSFLKKKGITVQQFTGPLGFDRWERGCDVARQHYSLIEHPDDSWEGLDGDIVHVARELNGHYAQHGFTLVEQESKCWKSVDGGQKNERGFQAIYERERQFVSQRTARNVVEVQSWKPVVQVIRVSQLLDALGL